MGMPIDSLTERQAIERVATGSGGLIATPNLDHLRRFGRNETVRDYYLSANLVVADGMPLIWASRIQGTPLPERIAGSNLIWTLSGALANQDRSIFLLGGNPGAADAAARLLRDRCPGLRIAGTACPPLGFERHPEAIESVAQVVATSGADLVFVGLPIEKEITLVEPLRKRMPSTWFIGVGVSFSFVSGEVVRAPRWMQRAGVEWIHRLVQEPRRLARRYLLEGLPLAVRLLGQALVRRGRALLPA
jgi:N-acetylglucosaminyldiphosphoundecaprenol N-acetyl-beta-D-mannosaminyltransferase